MRPGKPVPEKSPPDDKNISVVTLGCPKNIADSESLLRQLREGGYTISHNPSQILPGTVIVNTCGFINDAKEESIDVIMKFIRAKNEGKISRLFVTGCLAERYRSALRQEIPEVDEYFGVNDISGILDKLGLSLRNDLLYERELTGPKHFAWLKISEGCDRTCSFCAIPMIRGPYISKPFEEIVREASYIESMGVRELILVAQDLCYYGIDLYRKQRLPELVSELLKLKSFEWIRLQYLYPSNFPLQLIPVIRDNERVCSYIDIPIQHISDRMLKLMKRSHGRSDTEKLLNRLRQEIPGAAIRTTLIAGHPGETQDDFEELKDFISEFRFERLGVFAYSHEEGTYSGENYADDIPEEIKNERVAELMEMQQDISLEINRSLTGQVMKVLVDGTEGNFYTGRTQFDAPEIDQEVLIPFSYSLETGRFYNIRITEAEEFDLFGVPEE